MFWKKSPNLVLTSLLAIHLLAHIDRNMLLGFSSQIIADLSLSNAQYGFLVGAVWVLSFGAMALFMGTLADRFSRTRVIAAGVLIWSICTWASGHAQSFEHMVLARFFVASGEAALVPAAIGLLAELFSDKRRSSAMGVFFMGIPLGIGCSFLLAGTFGATHGWRGTFQTLGIAGAVIASLVAFLKDERGSRVTHERGTPIVQQVTGMLSFLREHRPLVLILIGFVLAHMIFAGLSFTQLWLVRERGMDAAGVASNIGILQLIFGTIGSLAGGVMGDRLARRLPGSHASLMLLLVLICAVPMLAYRFAAPGSAIFHIGMCAGFFLPLALYGPANAAVMHHVPEQMRSTISGFQMLCINVFAIALGNLGVGWAIDLLGSYGASSPITYVALATDVLGISSALFFALAARASSQRPIMTGSVQGTR
jgi:predicted MFS family arabinose efflux permease